MGDKKAPNLPEWVINDTQYLREYYVSGGLAVQVRMHDAAANPPAQDILRAEASDWHIAKITITLAEAERRWRKTNLRQNAPDSPSRWKSGGTWLTTTAAMARVYGPEPEVALSVTRGNGWKLYWGGMPLPQGAEALGIVTRANGQKGALIRLASGVFVQGNAGGTRTLDQAMVEAALG